MLCEEDDVMLTSFVPGEVVVRPCGWQDDADLLKPWWKGNTKASKPLPPVMDESIVEAGPSHEDEGSDVATFVTVYNCPFPYCC